MKTTILVDNATLAAAGRATYRQMDTGLPPESLNHISTYEKNFPTSVASDAVSLSELITSLILYDELTWNRGSCVEEDKDQFTGMVLKERLWVYSWFPLFQQANEANVLTEFQDYYSHETSRERESQIFSLKWVKEYYSSYKGNLPTDFKVPEIYGSDNYMYRSKFEQLNSKFDLNEEQLQVAMFIHRGLFYLSHVFSKEGYSYLPHGNRASFLMDEKLNLMAYVISGCNNYKYRIDANNISTRIDEVIRSKRGRAIGSTQISLSAIGGAFVHKHGIENAFVKAMEFRNSPSGIEVRQHFSCLVQSGLKPDNISLNIELVKISKEIDDITKAYLGGIASEITESLQLVGLPKWAEYLASKLPSKVQSSAVKAAHKVVAPSGYQLIFSNYLREKNG